MAYSSSGQTWPKSSGSSGASPHRPSSYVGASRWGELRDGCLAACGRGCGGFFDELFGADGRGLGCCGSGAPQYRGRNFWEGLWSSTNITVVVVVVGGDRDDGGSCSGKGRSSSDGSSSSGQWTLMGASTWKEWTKGRWVSASGDAVRP